MFSLHLIHKHFEFNASGFFNINCSLLQTVGMGFAVPSLNTTENIDFCFSDCGCCYYISSHVYTI